LRSLAVLIIVLALAGCTRPPQLATSIDIQKQSDDVVVVKVKVANLESHPTVPIALELTGQAQINGRWEKSATLLHPAAFVLNSKEDREITKFWRVPATAVRTTLVIREQERGNVVKTVKAEKVFASSPPTSR